MPENDQQKLENLLLSQHPCIFISTHEEEDALAMARQAAVELRFEMLLWSFNGGLRDGLIDKATPMAETEHPAAALFQLLRRSERTLVVMLDAVGHFKDERTLRLFRDLLVRFRNSNSHVILIDHATELSPVLRSWATEFELSLPDEKELEQIVKATLRKHNESCRLHVDLTRGDLNAMVRNLRGLSRRQARQVILDTVCLDQRFDVNDVGTIISEKRRLMQGLGLLEYVEAPVDLDQIGGLSRLKSWLNQRKNALSDAAVDYGISPPRGVLMLGVQGAGKSLSAKAVATAWQRPLLRMDVGALYDRYIGESERRLRDAFHQAEMMSPIILWIDEIEKAFASAASHSADGGLSKRMFGSLLTWMQEHTAPAFLIATANDIEALPPELLRKGRFDEIFFIDLPTDEARRAIFAIHLKKRKRDPKKFDLAALSSASEGYSGAEIEQAIVSALHNSFAAKRELTNDDILEALRASPPLSVTMAERVAELRQWSQGRCVPAD